MKDQSHSPTKQALLLIAILVSGLLAASCGRGDPSIFQMRLVEDSASSQTEQLMMPLSSIEWTSKPPEVLNVRKEVLMDDGVVDSANVTAMEGNILIPAVEVVFTEKGSKAFASLTRKNVGKRMAIVVDGKLLVAPIITDEIQGGRARILGNFSSNEASELARKINSRVRK